MLNTQIAEKLGVTPVTLSRWLNGHRFPRKDTMLRIELELGWSITKQMKAFNLDCPGGAEGEYGRQFKDFLQKKWNVRPREPRTEVD